MPAPPKSAGSSKKSKPADLVPLEPPPDPAAVNQVFEWIVGGYSEQYIAEAIAQYFPGQSLDALVNGAWGRLLKVVDVPQSVVVAWSIEATRACFQKLFELGDFIGAMRAAKQMADLAARLPPPDDPDSPEQGSE